MNIEIQKVYERKIVTLFFFVWGLSFFSRLSINFAMPTIAEKLTLTPSQIGTITFVSTIALAISSIIVSRIADKKGKYKVFLIFALMIIGICSLMTPLVDNYIEFIILRFIVGLGVGPILPIMMSICERSSSHNSFGKNTGLILAGDAIIASIFGPIIITQLTKFLSWQVTLAIVSVPTIIVGLICIKVIKENLALDKGDLKQENEVKVEVVNKQSAKQHKVIDIFKYTNIAVSMLLAILTLGGFFTISIYAPVYLTEVKGYNESTMGVIVSLNGIMYLPYALIISRLTDKFGRKPVTMIGIFLALLAPLSMFIFKDSIVCVVGYILFGGVSQAIHIFFNTVIPMESLPDDLKTTGPSVVIACGEIFGSAGVPFLMGFVADRFGYTGSMLGASILFGIALILAIFLKESNKNVIKNN